MTFLESGAFLMAFPEVSAITLDAGSTTPEATGTVSTTISGADSITISVGADLAITLAGTDPVAFEAIDGDSDVSFGEPDNVPLLLFDTLLLLPAEAAADLDLFFTLSITATVSMRTLAISDVAKPLVGIEEPIASESVTLSVALVLAFKPAVSVTVPVNPIVEVSKTTLAVSTVETDESVVELAVSTATTEVFVVLKETAVTSAGEVFKSGETVDDIFEIFDMESNEVFALSVKALCEVVVVSITESVANVSAMEALSKRISVTTSVIVTEESVEVSKTREVVPITTLVETNIESVLLAVASVAPTSGGSVAQKTL